MMERWIVFRVVAPNMKPDQQETSVVLSGETRLSEVLEKVPGALDYVVSLNPHDFTRLHNPFMRKHMSPRIKLRRVAAMALISEAQLLQGLAALNGDQIAAPVAESPESSLPPQSPQIAPEWMKNIEVESLHQVNVLAIDDVLGDPFPPISVGFKRMQPDEVILLRHRWEPQPLYDIWHKMDLEWFTRRVAEDEWHVFIYKPPSHPTPTPAPTVAVELRHLNAGEAGPRVVAMFEQLRVGQSLEITGAQSPLDEQVKQAMQERHGGEYDWQNVETATGKPMLRITARAVSRNA